MLKHSTRRLGRRPASPASAGLCEPRVESSELAPGSSAGERAAFNSATATSRTSRIPVAVVTGAGSGVGRACALRLVAAGWRVALVGRRSTALQRTIAATGRDTKARLISHPCDISDPAAVAEMAEMVLRRWKHVDAIINAAGTNVPRRSLTALSNADYHRLIATNLHGSYYCAQAFLPCMRRQRAGTIVNINSDAGLRASAKAGAGYVVSKFGLAGLTQTINAEERMRGIRACSIFPGDIDTPLLDKRAEPPPLSARRRMLKADDIASCVLLVLGLPARALVEELVIRPTRSA